jgi:hypothetical protein
MFTAGNSKNGHMSQKSLKIRVVSETGRSFPNDKNSLSSLSSVTRHLINQDARQQTLQVHGSALNRSSSASSGGKDNCMDESDQKILRLLWRKLRTSDEDGALNAICSLLPHGCGWANDCSGDGSALLHAVSRPLS